MASQITSLTIVYLTVYLGADQRKHQSSASLAFVRGIPVTGEFPAQMTSNAENVSIWRRHHEYILFSFRHIKCLMIYFVVTAPRPSRICSSRRKCYLRNQGLCCSTTWSVTQRLILLEIWPFLMYVYKTSSHFTLRVKRIAARTKRTAICWRHFKCIFLNEKVWISITISLKFVPKGPVNNIPALVEICYQWVCYKWTKYSMRTISRWLVGCNIQSFIVFL